MRRIASLTLFLVGTCIAAVEPGAPPVVETALDGKPWLNLGAGRAIHSEFKGPDRAVRALRSREARPLSMAAADFDEDGVPDLVCGFASGEGGIITLHRGNVDAIYPNAPEAKERRRKGTFTDAAFLPDARAFETPGAPDFLGVGDFDADGHWDVVTASRAKAFLEWLRGDGNGGFRPPEAIQIPGKPTALVTGEVNRRDGLTDLVVAIEGDSGPSALVFEGPEGALRRPAERLELRAPASALELGRYDDGGDLDLMIAAGETLTLVRGRDRRLSAREDKQAAVGGPVVHTVDLPFTIASMTTGDFDGDRKPDVALLDASGVLHAAPCMNLDTLTRTEGHRAESISALYGPQPVSAVQGNRDLLLSRARVSSRPGEDLMLLHRSGRLIHIRPASADFGRVEPERATGQPSGWVPIDVAGEPVALLPMRLNLDAQSDLVVLSEGAVTLASMEPMVAMTFEVTNTNPTGAGSLAQAINDANDNPGADRILFSIPGPGPHTIRPASEFGLTEAVTIDASTEPDVVEIDGRMTLNTGFFVNAGGVTFYGLVINRYTDVAIDLGSGLSSMRIEGCLIGTDSSGSSAAGNGWAGVEVNSDFTTIGGTAAAARNVISGNAFGGIVVRADFEVAILGNYIGTNQGGTAAIPNGGNGGIFLWEAPNVTIGGTSAGSGNVISGNFGTGISADQDSPGALVQGNRIGTNAAGSSVVGNTVSAGVWLQSASNLVGGTTPAARNVISGNHSGVKAESSTPALVTANLIQGNYIGITIDGVRSLRNLGGGVDCSGPNNVIGGNTIGARNVISGNEESGVRIDGPEAIGNDVLANYIGTTAGGVVALPNRSAGVTVGGSANRVGGSSSLTANVISGNLGPGVLVGGIGNLVEMNFIGTDPSGNFALGNQEGGIAVSGDNAVIGVKWGQANVISGNRFEGVWLLGGSGIRLQGNVIGLNAGGYLPLPNSLAGITISGGSSNVVGGPASEMGNVISGNGDDGIQLLNATSHNVIQNNRIGTSPDGSIAISNFRSGIVVTGASLNTIGGASETGNVIAHNLLEGVRVDGGDANSIRGNSIHGNGALGIDLLYDDTAPHGVSLNDPDDEDTGGNKMQNYPELSSVSTTGGSVRAAGSLHSRPGAVFDIDFYSVSDCDESGYGEGQVHLGSASVTTDSSGNATFDVLLSGTVPAGGSMTATATSVDGDTSEFSACASAVGVPPAAVSKLRFESTGSEMVLWDAEPGATFYHVYVGTRTTLAGLATPAADACELEGTVQTPGFTIPPAGIPPRGEMFWLLVTAEGPYGEGPVQPGYPGQRIMNSVGICGDSCAHDRCDVGEALVPACTLCASIVCAKDPLCCDPVAGSWNAQCVQEVRTVCRSLSCPESQGQCAHDLCSGGGGPLVPGCDSPPLPVSCTAAICQVDPHCCQLAWDDACQDKVATVCGYGCL